jgi:hypothetical protein
MLAGFGVTKVVSKVKPGLNSGAAAEFRYLLAARTAQTAVGGNQWDGRTGLALQLGRLA